MHPRKEQALCGPGWSVVHSFLCGCQPLCRCKSVQTAGLEGLGCCVCVCLMECAGAACGLHLPVRWNATVVSHMLESPLLHRITSGTHCNTQQEHHHHTTTLCELTAHRVFRVWEQECACPSSRVPVAVLVGLRLTWTHHHRAVATPEGFWEHYVLRMAVEHSWKK